MRKNRINHRLFIFLILTLTGFHIHAKQPLLTANQLSEDFKIFKGSITETHPGLYWYNDSATIERKFKIIHDAIQDKMDQTEFHRLLQEFYAGINCGHSWMLPPSEFIEKRDSGKYYFPFSVFFDNQKAYISKNFSSNNLFNTGDEILEIDGRPIPLIFEQIYKFIPSDGYNITGKNRNIASRFSQYYQQYIAMNNQVTLTLKDKGDQKTKSLTLQCLTKDEFEEKSKRFKKTSFQQDLLSFKILNNQTGVLTIKTFSKGWIKIQQKVKFKKFIKETFKEIKEKKVSKLILDLRFNGGGDDGLGALLNTYLIPQKFRYFEKMELSTKKFSYLKYSDTKGLKFVSLLLKKSKDKQNTYRWVYHKPLREQKPNKLVYKGALIVLINGKTFSTAADVCAILHAQNRAIFVGEEVGGGYYGNNSAVSMDILLPHSKIKYWIPLVRYTNYVDYPDFKGHGVIPDYKIPYTFDDYQNSDDLILKKSLILFEAKKTQQANPSN